MAQITYSYLRRKRDSYALAAASLGTSSGDDASVTAARLVLLAKALLELPPADAHEALGARVRLEAAQRLLAYPRDRRELPRLWILQGFLQYESDGPNGAYRLFDAAAAECRRLGDAECFAQARQNMAVLAEEQQNYPAALSDYEDALQALEAAPLPELVADISDNLGRLQGKVGLFSRSERSQREAMRLYGEVGDCEGARRSASSLGAMLMRVGSMDDAVTYLDQVISLDCPRLLGAARAAAAPDRETLPQAARSHGAAPTCARPPSR